MNTQKTPLTVASTLAVIVALFIGFLIVPGLSAAASDFNLNTFHTDLPKTEITRSDNEALFTWMEEAAGEIMNVRGRKYNNFLGDNREYFTDRGWRSYFKALEVSRVLDGIKKGSLKMSATLDDTAQTRIISAQQDQQAYYWAKTPITLIYETSKDTKNMESDLVVLITDTNDEFGIDQLIIYPRGEASTPISQ